MFGGFSSPPHFSNPSSKKKYGEAKRAFSVRCKLNYSLPYLEQTLGVLHISVLRSHESSQRWQVLRMVLLLLRSWHHQRHQVTLLAVGAAGAGRYVVKYHRLYTSLLHKCANCNQCNLTKFISDFSDLHTTILRGGTLSISLGQTLGHQQSYHQQFIPLHRSLVTIFPGWWSLQTPPQPIKKYGNATSNCLPVLCKEQSLNYGEVYNRWHKNQKKSILQFQSVAWANLATPQKNGKATYTWFMIWKHFNGATSPVITKWHNQSQTCRQLVPPQRWAHLMLIFVDSGAL